MIDAANNGGDDSVDVVSEVYGSIATTSNMLPLASPTSHTHAKADLEERKQARCIWFSRVYLV